MRVAYFTHYSALYGANRSLLCLLDGLVLRGVDPIVILPSDGPMVRELKSRGIPHEIVPFCLSVHWPPPDSLPLWRRAAGHFKQGFLGWQRSRRNRRLLSDLDAMLRRFNVELVHSNSSLIRIGIQSALRVGVPHVWHIREFGMLDWGFAQDGGAEAAGAWLLKSDSIAFVSEDLRSYYTRARSLPNAAVIYNGILSREEFRRLGVARATLRENRQGIRFAMVGYVNRSKGQHLAIEALAAIVGAHPAATLTIMGDGDLSELRAQAEALGLSKSVEFAGFVKDVTSVLLECDVLLMCSEREAFGRVTVEALASGCAVIARNTGGSREIIEDVVSGLMFDGSVPDLARKMELLCANEELRLRLARTGADDVARRFAMEDCVEGVIALYNRLGKR